MNQLLECVKKPQTALLFACFALFTLVSPVHAADLFAAGKSVVQETAGEDSTVELVLLVVAAVIGLIAGGMQRNWFVGIGGFAGTMIFWEIAKPLVGLT